MLVYHVDKFAALQPGQILQPRWISHNADPVRNARVQPVNKMFDGRLQMFSLQIMDNPDGNDPALWWTEIAFDYVRALKYPGLPSRFTVIFAARTVEDAIQWSDTISPSGSGPRILALKTQREVFAANALFRDQAYNRVSALFAENPVHPFSAFQSPQPHPAMSASQLLTDVLALAAEYAFLYWDSCSLASRMKKKLYPHEELLLVPPVRVLRQVQP